MRKDLAHAKAHVQPNSKFPPTLKYNYILIFSPWSRPDSSFYQKFDTCAIFVSG